MPENDFTNLEEAWDGHPASALLDPFGAWESVFYAGATATLHLICEGRSAKTLHSEIRDWLACQNERMKNGIN